jgi:Flp pilus assembly protein TadG
LKGGDSLRSVGILPSRGRKGQSMVELAIALPLMVLIMFGVLDLGRAFFTLITIHNAAREGARTASIKTTNNIHNICNAAAGETSSLGPIDKDKIVVSCLINDTEDSTTCSVQKILNCDRGAPHRTVVVSVGYDFTFLIPQVIGWNETISMTRSVEMVLP